MTDNEIIKALGLCSSEHLGCEDGCPYRMTRMEGHLCLDFLKKDVFDLINRQKAEIERLKIRKKEYAFCNLLGNCLVYSENLKDYNKMRIDLKAEAIKEFAERLKNATLPVTLGGKYKYDVITKEGIDNLVKEMVGDAE